VIEVDIKRWKMIIGLSISLFVIRILTFKPEWIERYYSQSIYPIIAGILSKTSSIFPFSLGESVLFIVISLTIIKIITIFLKKMKMRSMIISRDLEQKLRIRHIPSAVLLFVLLFQVVWGLNYSRLPLGVTLNLDVRPRESSELYNVLIWHIEEANTIRLTLKEDDFKRRYDIWTGYTELPEALQVVSKVKGRGKYLASSLFFSYAGIAGIYNPFFSEPNVNAMQVDFMLPVVEAHEIAHLQGVAREDEANYVAVRASLSHDQPFVNYSGNMLALIHLSNALYEVDSVLWEEAMLGISELVEGDLDRNREFWQMYDGWFEEASNDLNDTYLKMNGQEDGIQSYGRMVDLLLASFSEYKNK